MKAVLFATILASLVVSGTAPAVAGEGKDKAAKAAAKASADQVTLTGDMVCAKCNLHEAEKCQNVLKVAEGGKETRYYLEQNKVAKDNHETVCKGQPHKATVTGKVKEADGKKVLTAASIKYE
jgi:hypothetical protein